MTLSAESSKAASTTCLQALASQSSTKSSSVYIDPSSYGPRDALNPRNKRLLIRLRLQRHRNERLQPQRPLRPRPPPSNQQLRWQSRRHLNRLNLLIQSRLQTSLNNLQTPTHQQPSRPNGHPLGQGQTRPVRASPRRANSRQHGGCGHNGFTNERKE